MVVKPEPGVTMCNTWDVTDCQGEPITVGFVARSLKEVDDGSEHMVARAMNWRSVREGPSIQHDDARPADPRRAGRARGAPGVGRPDALDAAEMARRAVPVLRLARRDRRAARSSRRQGRWPRWPRSSPPAPRRGAADGRSRRRVDTGPRDGAPGRARRGRLCRPGVVRLPTEAELAVAGLDQPAEGATGKRKLLSRKERTAKT